MAASKKKHIEITDTGFPVGLSKIDPSHRDVVWSIVGCGCNLDAPAALMTGGLFYAPLVREAMPAICLFR